jgi:hypothetical protein
MSVTPDKTTDRNKRGRRVPTLGRVQSLESLVGAHPDALRDLYAAGKLVDPSRLDGLLEARLLAFEPLTGAFAVTRSLVQLYSRITPWKGKVFEAGGASGADQVARFSTHRFRCVEGASLLDGEPTLSFHYDQNPWPMSKRVDELRSVGDGVALGPIFVLSATRPLLWWGARL